MNNQYIRKACIEYETKFEHDKLERVTLQQNYEDGSNKKKKCPAFNGDYGIEALLFVKDRFDSICRQLEFTTGEELFDNFEEVLTGKAQDKWYSLTGQLGAAQRTVPEFTNRVGQLYLSYCSDDARDAMFEYLRAFKKPYKMEAGAHADRIEILAKYANRLPGNEPALTDDQIKVIIFKSFPAKWQHQYIQSGHKIVNSTLQEIIQYMKDEKSFSDTMDKNKKRGNDDSNSSQGNKRIRGGGPGRWSGGRNNRSSNRGRRETLKTPCRKHNGAHEWDDCWDNPNGASFRPNRGYNSGRGRGNYQRRGNGNYQGRGGGGRPSSYGNSNYQRNNYQQNQGNSYHQDHYHNARSSHGAHSGSSNNTTISSHPTREVPPIGYAPEMHHLDLIFNQSGSAWSSTGNPHDARRNGGRWWQ